MKRYKKSISIFLLILFINTYINPIQLNAITLTSSDVIVVFKDKNLEDAVRQAINKTSGNIYSSELADINYLNASGKDISYLDGIEYLSKLQYLYLSQNKISDLTPIKKLISLNFLDISYNNISDLTPISELTALSDFRAVGCSITSMAPLSKLNKLTYIALSNNKISNIDVMKNFTELCNFSLTSNQISDISALETLTKLETIDIQSNKINNITPLSKLEKLKFLSISSNKISDLSPISKLSNLEDLYLSENSLTDLTALSNLINLKNLHLTYNRISNVEPLKNLTNLRMLWLTNNRIYDISSLSNLKNLQNFMVNYNFINEQNLETIKNFKKLVILSLSGNPIKSIETLKENPYNFPYLKAVDLWGVQDELNGLTTDVYPELNDHRFFTMQSRIQNIIKSIIKPDMTDFEKVLAVHDYVVNNTTYSTDDTTSVGEYSLLIDHKAFCSTYSNTVDTLLNSIGIESRSIGGEGHAWNMVKIDGEFYHFDTTWDDENDTGYNYTYFLLSDDEIQSLRSGPAFNWNSELSGLRYNKDQPFTSTKYTFARQMLTSFKNKRNLISFKNNWIYYANELDNNYLYKVSINGTQKIKLINDPVSYIKLEDGWVYYINSTDNNLYKIPVNGNSKQAVDELRVIKEEPKMSSNGFSIDESLKVTFNSNITLKNANLISLKSAKGNSIPLNITINNNILIAKPTHKLLGSEDYVLTIPKETINGTNSSNMDKDYILNFSTAAENLTKPSINLEGDVYFDSIDVKLSSDQGSIYYTLNGTDPTASSNKYTSSIKITDNSVLKYVVIDASGNESRIFTQIYIINKNSYGITVNPGTPVVSKTNQYNIISLSFESESINHAVFFTVDGSEPTTDSIRSLSYGILPGQKIKYIILDKAGNKSPTFEVTFKSADINNDKEVNILDISEVARKYNTKTSSDEWSNAYDMNNDTIIDIYDIVSVSKYYGQ